MGRGLIVPFALQFGADATLHQVAHALLLEYLPFVVVLFALYTIAGGICVRGHVRGHAGAQHRAARRWAPRSRASWEPPARRCC